MNFQVFHRMLYAMFASCPFGLCGVVMPLSSRGSNATRNRTPPSSVLITAPSCPLSQLNEFHSQMSSCRFHRGAWRPSERSVTRSPRQGTHSSGPFACRLSSPEIRPWHCGVMWCVEWTKNKITIVSATMHFKPMTNTPKHLLQRKQSEATAKKHN